MPWIVSFLSVTGRSGSVRTLRGSSFFTVPHQTLCLSSTSCDATNCARNHTPYRRPEPTDLSGLLGQADQDHHQQQSAADDQIKRVNAGPPLLVGFHWNLPLLWPNSLTLIILPKSIPDPERFAPSDLYWSDGTKSEHSCLSRTICGMHLTPIPPHPL